MCLCVCLCVSVCVCLCVCVCVCVPPSQHPPFLLRPGPPSCPANDPAQPCLSWDPAAQGGKCRQPAGCAPGRPVQPAFSLSPGPQGGSLCSPAPVLPSPGSPGCPAPLSTPLTQRPQGSRCLLCMRPGWLSGSPSPAPCGIGGVLAAAPDVGRTRPLGWACGWSLSHRHTQPGAILHVAVMRAGEQRTKWGGFCFSVPCRPS